MIIVDIRERIARAGGLAAGLLVVLAGGIGAARATIYEVGDGQAYASIGAVPWESLAAGDEVRIHWRATPYQEKWVIAAQGTAADPVVVRGIPAPDGALPVIDGNGATTRQQLDYWSETRGVIKIGGSSNPPNVMPRHVVIENLEIRSARPPYSFTDDGGSTVSYPNNAAAIYVEKGEHITVRGCTLHDCGNGLFVASSDATASRDILIEHCHIYDNGNVGSIYEHNTYTAAIGITYQFNRFGPLRAGAGGNSLKDRSAGLVVRYNWLEGGNRQFDLVDAEDSSQIESDPSYRETFVYGNVVIESEETGNRQILHYGGDSGVTGQYRKGRLYFYHNTVIATRSAGMTLLRLSTNDETCDARNNLLWVTGSGSSFAYLDSTGVLDISHNLLKPGWMAASSGLAGTLNDDGTSVETGDPVFIESAAQDFRLAGGSPGVNAATGLPAAVLPAHVATWQYVRHQALGARPMLDPPDIGAFEFLPGDYDGDGAVTVADAAWPTCATGPGGEVTTDACMLLDLDGNNTTDLSDFRRFQDVLE
jgi:hypothetical protein